jgi:hypothetical protein
MDQKAIMEVLQLGAVVCVTAGVAVGVAAVWLGSKLAKFLKKN